MVRKLPKSQIGPQTQLTDNFNFMQLLIQQCMPSGAVLEGFLRFPETIQDFPSTMGAPLSGYNISRGIHSGLNSSVTGFCFDSKLRKCREDLFFWSPRRKIGQLCKICVAALLETLREDPTVRVHDKQAVWKLLSKISRTTPVCHIT